MAQSATKLAGQPDRSTRLFSEELPGELAPTETARELEVAMVWGDQIINVRHIPLQGRCTMGSGASSDFQLFNEQIGASTELAVVEPSGAQITIPASAKLWVRRGDATKTREELSGELKNKGSHSVLTLGLRDRVQFDVDGLSFVARWVKPAALDTSGGDSFDFFFSKILTTTFMAGAAVIIAMTMTDMNAETLSEDLFRNQSKYAKVVFKAVEKEKKKKQVEVVKKEETAREVVYTTTKTNKTGPVLDANKRESDKRKVMSSGLLSILGGTEGSTSSVLGGSGLGTGINNALGAITDSGVSDLGGVAGLGSRGVGAGGGGGGLGIGGIGTKSGGRGSMGGYGNINIGNKGKSETRIVPGKTTVVGSCERTSIGKVINSRANEIRFCYESELTKNPNLAGRVAVSFTIGPTGGVESAEIAQSDVGSPKMEDCILGRIRRWKFPEPKGGGSCVINYPWVFKAAGSEEE